MLAGRSAAASRCTISYGQALYSRAFERRHHRIESNPFKNLPKPGLTGRERVLSDEELAAIWHATEAAAEPRPDVFRPQRKFCRATAVESPQQNPFVAVRLSYGRASLRSAHDAPIICDICGRPVKA
jgi:hypothetical protein